MFLFSKSTECAFKSKKKSPSELPLYVFLALLFYCLLFSSSCLFSCALLLTCVCRSLAALSPPAGWTPELQEHPVLFFSLRMDVNVLWASLWNCGVTCKSWTARHTHFGNSCVCVCVCVCVDTGCDFSGECRHQQLDATRLAGSSRAASAGLHGCLSAWWVHDM